MIISKQFWLCGFTLLTFCQMNLAQDANPQTEAAIKTAVSKVAASLVKIETSGGLGSIGTDDEAQKKGRGPTRVSSSIPMATSSPAASISLINLQISS